ncbi:MAG: hypothetical protein ACLFS8_06935 [Clostridia bacterium]
MSHIATYSTELALNPVANRSEAESDHSYQLFEEALEVVAEEYNGRVDTSVADYFGRKRECAFSLITPPFPAGIGVDVEPETGRVSFVYDSYGVSEDVIDTLRNRIVQTFTSLAISRALSDMNYEVEYEEAAADPDRVGDPRRRILIRGVM